MKALDKIIHRLERMQALDGLAKPVVAVVGRAVQPRMVRNLISGTYLGHPLHPMLTDLPIGAWSMSTLLDTIGGRAAEPAADLLVKAGVLSAVPAAASGLNDWSDTQGAETRLGLVHATVNTTALGLYTASLIARARGDRSRGKALGLVGFGVLVAGSYLGGHLSFGKGVNVNQTAWLEQPTDWTPVLADTELPDRQHRKVEVDGAGVLLYRNDGQVWALANTCSHMGGPLDEGTLADNCVTCPWHGSIFRFTDGGIVRGPATSPQPWYETRVRDGQIELRAAP